jgi:hypothetical protein
MKTTRARSLELKDPRARKRPSPQPPKTGRLIALEASGGNALVIAAKRLQKALKKGKASAGVSPWDASGIFYDILQGPREVPGATPRTIVLLYAADLAFRLRWQIRPALEDGATVIAAPYVETGIAFGRAAGISLAWLRELFSFAPAANTSYRLDEDSIPQLKRGKPADNFLEFAFLQMRRGSGRWPGEELRTEFTAYLKNREQRGTCTLLTAGELASPGT